ncbi:MAG: hypothetical protein JWL76_587 [Thermoleophilia bacterium]|nr:hypothetical protein [Thermoleophilia bacterium]
MRVLAQLSTVMAGLLVGLGVAVFARAVREVGFDHLVLGHIVGPGLVAAGLIRIRLQRMLDGPRERSEGDDG